MDLTSYTLSKQYTDSQLAEKATKEEVDSKVSQIVSGSPKGTYATLSALQTAFPTGTTGVYLVTADGKWYYWAGSAWTAGGTYQATSVAENSVQPAQFSTGLQTALGFTYSNVSLTVQLATRADVSSNQLLLSSSAYYNVASFDVQPGEKYQISTAITNSGVYSVRFFDVSNNQISQLLNGNGTSQTTYTDYAITVPANAVKMYINRQLATSGDTTPPTAKKYGSVALAPQTNVDVLAAKVADGTAINNGAIDINQMNFITVNANLFNRDDVSLVDYNHRYEANGYENTNDTDFWKQVCTLKFPVKGGTNYTRNHAYRSSDTNISGALKTAFFDTNGARITTGGWASGTATMSDSVTGTTPTNAVTAYAVVEVKYISDFMFVEGGTLPSEYAGYGAVLPKYAILPQLEEYKASVGNALVPDYWKTYIDGKYNAILTEQMKSGRNSVCFGFFTDYHDQYGVGGLGPILKYLDSKINMSVILNGGDFLDNDGYASKDLAVQDVKKCYADFEPILSKMLVVDGNHERTYDYNTNSMFSENELFSLLQRGNTKDIKPSDSNSMNFYYDDEKFKTRYIGLAYSNTDNTATIKDGLNQDTLIWLINVLHELNAKSDCSDWAVVLLTHNASPIANMLPNFEIFYGILKAVKNKSPYTVNGGTSNFPVNISVNDSNDGNSVMFNNNLAIVGVFTGHAHRDWLGTSFDGVDTGINISLSCADSLLDRTANKKTTMEHTFDIVCVDKKNRYVKSFRFGGNKPADGYSWDGTIREWNY